MTQNTAPSFIVGSGKIISAYGGYGGDGVDSVLQSDGKLVVVDSRFGLSRFNVDGSRDATFGVDGRAVINYSSNYVWANSIAIQSDGKFVVAGIEEMPVFNGNNIVSVNYALALARYNSDGSLDTTFDGDGKLSTPFDLSTQTLYGQSSSLNVSITSDGKILTSFTSYSGDFGNYQYYYNFQRYNSNGSLDTSYDGDGLLTVTGVPAGLAGGDGNKSVVQSDGKVLRTESAYDSTFGTDKFVVHRFNIDGSPDASFNGTGSAITDIGLRQDYPEAIAVQPDGKILVAGATMRDGLHPQEDYVFGLVRYNVDGSLDVSFGNGGKVIADFSTELLDMNDFVRPYSGSTIAKSIVVQSDGKIILTGEGLLARFNPDGSLDNTYGRVNTLSKPMNTYEIATKILDVQVAIYDPELAALNNGLGDYSGASVSLSRHSGANREDQFSGDSSGNNNLSLSGGNALLSGINVGSVSNIYGVLTITFNSNATQSRVNQVLSSINYTNVSSAPPESLQIDWVFNDGNNGSQGSGGAQSTSGSTTVNIQSFNTTPSFFVPTGKLFTDFYQSDDDAYGVAIQPNGMIILAGSSIGGHPGTGRDFALARYYSNGGSIDGSFGVLGKVSTTFGSLDEAGQSVALQQDGKIVVAGYTATNFPFGNPELNTPNVINQGVGAFAVARYNNDGSLDTTFGVDGKVITQFVDVLGSSGRGVALQSDGKILVAGSANNFITHGDFALVRYNQDGSLDTSFDTDGKVTLDFGGIDDAANTVLQVSNGKVLVVGLSSGGLDDFLLARLNSDGSLDSSFGNGGKVTTDFGGTYDKAYSAVEQSDGKVLVAGSINNQSFGIARYNLDGSLDTTFDGDGLVTTNISPYENIAHSITLQADGKILVAGNSRSNFILARYNQNGSLDTTFGNAGMVTTDIGSPYADARSVAVEPDGRILVVGKDGHDFVTVRYNTDGSLDRSFGYTYGLGEVANFTENGLPTLLDSQAQVYDAEFSAIDNYKGSKLTLERHDGANSEDVFSAYFGGNLSFVGNAVILSGATVGSVDNSNGKLVIKFDHDITEHQINEVLSSIAYKNTSYTPPASVQIDWEFNDDYSDEYLAHGSSTVNITPVNNLPSLTGVSASLATGKVDVSYNITKAQLLTGFTDAEGDAISMSGLTADHGVVVDHHDGTYTITPDSHFRGLLTLRYNVTDGIGGGVLGTQNINFLAGSGVTVTDSFASIAAIESAAGNILALSGYYRSFVQSLSLFSQLSSFRITSQTPSRIDGSFGNGNTISLTGNFAGYPINISSGVFNLPSTHNRFSFSGAVSIADQSSPLTGTITNLVLQDTQTNTKLTIDANYDLLFDSLTSISGLQLEGNGANLSIRGSFVEDNSAAGISGTINSISLIYGSSNISITGLQMSYASFDSFNTFTGILSNVLSGDDTINGTTGSETLFGFTGNDTMIGGDGNDVYIVDNAGDTVVESSGLAGSGVDRVESSVSWTLGANLENLKLTGTDAINGTGNELNNVIRGNAANNLLDGKAGNDSLFGGDGNDVYIVDSVGDSVVESSGIPGSGVDRVESSVNWTLGANVENLKLTGTDNINGTGNELNNVLRGNSGNNVLDGQAGNDILLGGAGSDTYVIDSLSDVITENLNEGGDQVNVGINAVGGSYTLGDNLEYGQLINTVAFNLNGNGLDNYLTGNAAGNILDGKGGNDTMVGGDGNDVYIVDSAGDSVLESSGAAGSGIDRVESSVVWILGNNVENLKLTGTDMIGGFGNELNNVIRGNVANNQLWGFAGDDYLDGGFGSDLMLGGLGNDTYVVDNLGDVASEGFNEGTDLVKVDIAIAGGTYTLDDYLENGQLINTVAFNLNGNGSNNQLTGNAANNILDGKAGNDIMVGGDGNDVYIVDSAGDSVVESSGIPGSGVDRVESSVSWVLGLGSFVENLKLTGTDNINGTGNELNNVLRGNVGDNVLDGQAGNDMLLGGAGNDTYVIDSLSDVITENVNEGTDLVKVGIITAGGSYTLGDNLENAQLTNTVAFNLNGNGLDNQLTGNAAGNILDGKGGNDSLFGGDGNDVYIVDSVGDSVVESSGIPGSGVDRVESSVSWTLGANVENLKLTGTGADNINGTGNELNNVIRGNAANNILDGKGGSDSLFGGDGNDVYIVDSVGDSVVESSGIPGSGVDRVESSVSWVLGLGSFVENLKLTGTDNINGTGNELNNVLRGNVGDNVLDGQAGNDMLLGGAGNDTYVIDSLSDVITENVNEGTDLVKVGIITAGGSYTLGDNLENAQLTNTVAFNLNGNGLDNQLTGNAAGNILDGKGGNDSLFGGDGNDVYIVDSVGDSVVESSGIPGSGVDRVESSVSWTLGANVENLKLTGTGADNINGTGNELNNVIRGNAANNILDGKGGSDSLFGGDGNDTYQFARGDGVDTIVEDDATLSNTDVLKFSAGISYDQLWFTHAGNNLEVSVIGTTDKNVIKDWYTSTANHVEQFKTTDGSHTLLDSKVQALVDAMAGLTPPAAGETTLSNAYQTQLAPTLAANWQ